MRSQVAPNTRWGSSQRSLRPFSWWRGGAATPQEPYLPLSALWATGFSIPVWDKISPSPIAKKTT